MVEGNCFYTYEYTAVDRTGAGAGTAQYSFSATGDPRRRWRPQREAAGRDPHRRAVVEWAPDPADGDEDQLTFVKPGRTADFPLRPAPPAAILPA